MLELDLTTILFEIANFVLLSALLYRFLFRPLNQKAQERATAREAAEQVLAAENGAVSQLKAELAAELSRSQAVKESILEQAHDQARAEREELLQAARQEAEKILISAHEGSGRWQITAVERFRDDMVKTLLAVCHDLLAQVVPREAHDRLVAELNQRIWQMGQDEMERVETLRLALATRKPTLQIKTALSLSPEQRNQLVGTFAALADQDVLLELDTVPELLAGLKVRLGDLVVENSLLAKLQALQDQASHQLKTKVDNDDSGQIEAVSYAG